MNLLPGVSMVKIGVYIAVALALMGFGAYGAHKWDAGEYQKLRGEYATYKTGVEILGAAAAKDALEEDMRNTLSKRSTDAEIKAGRSRIDTDARRVRDDIADRGVLPEAATAPGSTAGAGVVWPDVESALREFTEDAARAAAEGDRAVEALDALKRKQQRGD